MNIPDFLLSEKAVAAAFGVVGGAIASLIAPWVHWRIERHKMQYQWRKERIDKWRAMITRVSSNIGDDDNFGELILALYRDTDFISLKRHLSQDPLGMDEVSTHELFEALLADIDAIEKKWGITES